MKKNLLILLLVVILFAVLAGAIYLGYTLFQSAATSPSAKAEQIYLDDPNGFTDMAENFAETLTIERLAILSETNCKHVQTLKNVYEGHDYCVVELNDQKASDCDRGCSFVGVDDIDVVLDKESVKKTEYIYFAEFMQEHHILAIVRGDICDQCISFTIDPLYLSAQGDARWLLVYMPENAEISSDVKLVSLDEKWGIVNF